jgi:hypothetical protein
MRKSHQVFYVIVSLFLFSSCVSNRKISQLNQSIESQKKLEIKLDSTLASLNSFRQEKNTVGELDDTSSLAIKKILENEITQTKSRTDSLSDMQSKLSGKRIKKREYKNMVSVISVGTAIITTKMETVDFVDQLLKQQTFIKFNTAAFFPPGGYKIPSEKMADAKLVFEPLIDSLIAFVQRFPKFTLVSSIVASGYADGTGFSPGELVNTLTANLGKTEATKEELNQELSRLRAEEISGILIEIFKEKISKLNSASSLNTRFFKTGKGEEYPNKKIKDYQVDDERRRIVVIYWNALPEGK